MHGTARRALALVAVVAVVALVVAVPGAPAGADAVDPTYGAAGFARSDPGVVLATAVVQPDGRVVVAGSFQGPGQFDWYTARYTARGQLDPTWGEFGTGMRLYNLTGGTVSEGITAAALVPGGGVVFAGYSDTSQTTVLLRTNADGVADTSYAGDGADYVVFGNAGTAIPAGVAVQPDGRIVVASELDHNGATSSIGVARLSTAGVLDATFSGDGRLTTSFTFGGIQTPHDLLLQPDGRVLVAGRAASGSSGDFGFLRLTTAGDPDPSFDLDGRAVVDMGDDAAARALGLLSDGRIVEPATSRVRRTSRSCC